MKWARMLALAAAAVIFVTTSLLGSSEAKAVAPSAAGNKQQGNPGAKKRNMGKNNECGSKELCELANKTLWQQENLSNLNKLIESNGGMQQKLGKTWSPVWSQILRCGRSKNKKPCHKTITKNQTVYLEPFYQLRGELNLLSKKKSLCDETMTVDESLLQLNKMIRTIEDCSNKTSPELKRLSLSVKDMGKFCSTAHAVLTNFETLGKSVVNTSCPKPKSSPKPKKSTQRPGVTRKPQTGKRTTDSGSTMKDLH